MMTHAERNAYCRGYNAALRGRWPIEAATGVPHREMRTLAQAALALYKASDKRDPLSIAVEDALRAMVDAAVTAA